jgi:peptidoglycan hydrolase-like protein with peptidoglycan-binding domain
MRLVAVVACVVTASAVQADFNRGFDAWDAGKYARALTEFQAAAKAGDSRAQNHLGQMYEDGQGSAVDIGAAVRWYRRAAKAGEPAAQLNLGRLYRSGKGVEQSDALAVRWYRAAAEQGLGIAQFFMGLMYDTGKGVPSDYVQAYKWFDLAARQGDSDARHKRDRLANHMTPSQVVEAERQSGLFLGEKVARSESTQAPQGGRATTIQEAPAATVAVTKPRVVVAMAKPANEVGYPQVTSARATVRALSRPEVKSVQQLLNQLGYNAGKPDGVSGRGTRAAAERFGTDMSNPDMGVGRELLVALERVKAKLPKKTSSPGRSAQLVKRIQEALTSLGYAPGTADGIAGSKTLNAAEQYRSDIGVVPNKKLDAPLLSALEMRITIRNLASTQRQPGKAAAAIAAATRTTTSPRLAKPAAVDNRKLVQDKSAPAKANAAVAAAELPKLDGADLTRAVQQGLNRLGFNAGSADGVSGSRTVKAIRTFERESGLSESGKITHALYALIEEQQATLAPPPKFITPATDSERTSRIQAGLSKLGFDPGPVDGVAGKKTIEAAKRFQTRAKVERTGKLDDNLLRKLEGPAAALIDGPRLRVVRPTTERELVRRIQVRLNSLGYAAGAPDGVPGSKTYSAAKAFQTSARARADGTLDQKLLQLLEAVNAPKKAVAKKSQSHAQLVRDIQGELNRLGYPAGTADGIVGTRTVTAAKLFQRDVGLSQTGKLSPGLLRKLKTAR